MRDESNEAVTRVVFIGPSMPAAHADAALRSADTRILPPVKRGDVDRAAAAFPNLRSVGIVDGEFFQSFSISPKEILRSMDKDKRFFGSSSMGALRAAELAVYGMRGIGTIYELFASGEIDADDEVAMTFDPFAFQALSEPLVNIRLALGRACQLGALDPEVRDIALREIKQIYFPQRTYRAMLHAAKPLMSSSSFQQLSEACRNAASAKHEDAACLLAAMDLSFAK